MLVVWNEYSALSKGVQLRQVCCAHCGGWYFYEMLRYASGKGTSLYMVDNDGASRRAERGAAAKLQQRLNEESDPVPCPHCQKLQPNMISVHRTGAPLPVPGMPPALVLVEQHVPETGESVQCLETAHPQKAPIENGWVTLQLDRIALPDACCVCAGPSQGRFRLPLRTSEADAPLLVPVCRACERQTRRTIFAVATLGWTIALMTGAVAVAILALLGAARAGPLAITVIASLVLGLTLMFVLPLLKGRPYHLRQLDIRRGISKIRFTNSKYAAMVAATVEASLNAGQVFRDTKSEAVADLGFVVDDEPEDSAYAME